MSLESLYQEIILDHYKRPKNKVLQDKYSVEVHHNNPSCGDEVTLRVQVENQIVTELSWDGVGCSISQASSSVMSELTQGIPVEKALQLEESFLELMQGKGEVVADEEELEDAIAFSGVARYPARVKCALLGWMALKDALLRAGGSK
ncbi:MAG: SUF system NifU family Fe-S cluster assembly protein [Actinomycetes bacterium]|jgi:nitrogen fixation NifU-like protein|nr:SUF system NifU family Fe-S cluster assembly protein [Actinomycetota bacterium]